MFESPLVSPSILSADFMRLGQEISDLERCGADWIHVDVMDGHFVPNLTIGVPVTEQLKSIASIPLDVHLMISNPLEQLPWYLNIHPHVITCHYEAFESRDDMYRASKLMRDEGVLAGIALRPDTDTSVLRGTYAWWDMVLVMSVMPGFSGQSFKPESPARIASVVADARAEHANPLIQVDGGISAETAPLVAHEGASVFVAGNAVCKAIDRRDAILSIKSAVEQVKQD